MADINIENISDLDLNGNDLFQDSESFIIDLDDDAESIVGGGCGFTGGCIGTGIGVCGATNYCGDTIN